MDKGGGRSGDRSGNQQQKEEEEEEQELLRVFSDVPIDVNGKGDLIFVCCVYEVYLGAKVKGLSGWLCYWHRDKENMQSGLS